ncbi:uncharacterized protein TRIADDRAFT_62485 [Trichoplax adhaerens]|uniref:Phospholipid scramblase n=1 Tax=Trichoplax adhaerens TaxID=10228 RepID=B3SDY1_TRIAD|nr:hypothetical protein TRIADDRAFT_62485 [Trichoplax adhaerens]EDV19064.1 hypothetical protein TRIADDRAFT_62485 [Trichoplax adhaerens]|eukprot:XP_002118450.1 hypothetical protein TRIADDRAFT_62485 [Trichoplax adhaerens]
MANRPLPNDGNQPPSYADTVKDEQSMNVPMAQPPLSEKEIQEVTPSSPSMNTLQEKSPQIVPTPMPRMDISRSPLPPPILQQPEGAIPVRPPISQQPIAGVRGPNPTTQSSIPQQLTWMPLPAPNTVSNDCPTGLERLSQISQVIISPDIGKSELFMPTFQNKYQVKNNAGQLIYYAVEDNTITMDIMSWNGYNLAEIGLYDSNERKVIQLSRVPTGKVAACFDPNFYKIHIASPPEVMIGKIVQMSACGPKHVVTSPNDIIELLLNGPGHCYATPLEEGSLSFQIISESGTEIGSMGKYFPTMGRFQCDMEVNCTRIE